MAAVGGPNRGHGTVFYAGLALYSWIGLMRHSHILVNSLSLSGVMKRIQHDRFTKDSVIALPIPNHVSLVRGEALLGMDWGVLDK